MLLVFRFSVQVNFCFYKFMLSFLISFSVTEFTLYESLLESTWAYNHQSDGRLYNWDYKDTQSVEECLKALTRLYITRYPSPLIINATWKILDLALVNITLCIYWILHFNIIYSNNMSHVQVAIHGLEDWNWDGKVMGRSHMLTSGSFIARVSFGCKVNFNENLLFIY